MKKTSLLIFFIFISNFSCVGFNGNSRNIIKLVLTENETLRAKENPTALNFICEDFSKIFEFKPVNGKSIIKKDKVLFTGKIIIEYNDKRKYAEINFKDGQKEGEEYIYFPNNSMAKKSIYKAGLLDGISNIFYLNGNLATSNEYKNGILSGMHIKFYYNGNKELEGKQEQVENLFQILKIGQWTYYYENGNKKEEGEWKNLKSSYKKMGIWKIYNENGILIEEKNYGFDIED